MEQIVVAHIVDELMNDYEERRWRCAARLWTAMKQLLRLHLSLLT